jgi:subtilisin family serine protease
MPRISCAMIALLALAVPALAGDRLVVMTHDDWPPLRTGAYAACAELTGIPALDAVCRASGVVTVERFYPGTLRKPGLARLAARLRVLGFAAGVRAEAVAARFAALPCLASAEVPRVPRLFYTPNDGSYTSQWYLPHVGAPAAWDIIRGDAARAGVVAVIDTGIDVDHPEFVPNLWINAPEDLNHNGRLDAADIDGQDQDGNGFEDDVCGWDFTDNDPFAEHDSGHGNGVAACVSEATDNHLMGAGLGFGVRLMPLQGISGGGYLAEGYLPMLYAADNGANVINCSWGIPVALDYEQAIVNAVWDEDVVIVAAGGEGSQVVYPAGYDHVMAVSATDATDHKASFGPWGAYIDICAPGVNILTIWDYELLWVSGTSFASGMVAGLAGLVRAAWPQASAAETVALIEDTAVDLDALNPGYAGLLGAGRIDAAAAVGATTSSAPRPDESSSLRCGPNPFNAATVVAFALAREAAVDLAVYDLRGRRVAMLAQERLSAGPHEVAWDAAGLPSGSYQVRLVADGRVDVARVTLVK